MNQYVDLETALGRVRGNKALYKKMLGMFTGSEEFVSLDTAINAQDWARGADVAHGIKGMTGNLGLTRVFETSEKLMIQMRAGEPESGAVEAYKEALAKTRDAVAQLMEEL